jgi:hypothetical protein
MKDKMGKIYSKREELWKEFEKEFWKQFNQTVNFSDYLNETIPKSEIRKNRIKKIFSL